MTDRPHGDDDRGDDRRPSRGSWLSTLIDALEHLEGRSNSGRSRINYDVSIRSGLGEDDDRPAAIPESGPSGPPARPRERRTRTRGGGNQLLTTRRYDDEFVVIAELSGADPEDVTVGFDGSTLVVGIDGRERERVEVPWPVGSSRAVVRNGLLTVRVEPEEEGE